METTGLCNAEVVQVGIINHEGSTVLETLVKPTTAIPNDAIAIHGITNEAVANAPSFSQIYPEIVKALADRKVLIYHADARYFRLGTLPQDTWIATLRTKQKKRVCHAVVCPILQ